MFETFIIGQQDKVVGQLNPALLVPDFFGLKPLRNSLSGKPETG
jgi:hypothetical protein